MSTSLDEEKLESVLYETSNVTVYRIPSPAIFNAGDHIQEYHDINKWNLTKDNIIFKGILRVKEQEFFNNEDDSDDDYNNDHYGDNSVKRLKPAAEEAAERFKLIVELIDCQDFKIWATIQYYCLSPHITTVDNTSFQSIQLVNNSNLFSTFITLDQNFKIGCGLKFPNRIESNNFQMVLNNYLKDFHNYTEMIQNNRDMHNDDENYDYDYNNNNNNTNYNNNDNDISIRLENTQLNENSRISVKEVEKDADTDDDEFGDFVG